MNQEYENWVSWQKPFWKNILKLKIKLKNKCFEYHYFTVCGKITMITVVERQALMQNPHYVSVRWMEALYHQY